jgi:hypothetical protein
MDQSNQNHPGQEALERFVLHQCMENELEMIETHSLWCEFCVERLEILDVDISATKLALQNVLERQLAQRSVLLPYKSRGTSNLPRIFGASAALAACVLCVVLSAIPSRVTLSVTRGTETITVSTWRPIEMHLDVKGLDQGPVVIQIVDYQGATIWQGKTNVGGHEDMNVRVPRFRESGIYFVRICAVAAFSPREELVREFALRVQSPL